MPVFKATYTRNVSRVVSLRQTCYGYITANNVSEAQDAAWRLAHDDEIHEYSTAWEDDEQSRQASNDREDGPSKVERVVRGDDSARIISTSAAKILGIKEES